MKDRSDYYSSKNPSCGKYAYIYNKRKHTINDCNCKQFSCGYCRQPLLTKRLNQVVKSSIINKLTRHMVITMKGDIFRSLFNPDESFKIFSNYFNSFITLYDREFNSEKCYLHYFENDLMVKRKIGYSKFDNFKYIGFRRSDKKGYCHLHALVGRYIPKNKLQEICNRVNLGFSRIDFVDVHRLKRYLSKYWYKDHEWYIPKNKKHFTKSQSINFDDNKNKNDFIMITKTKDDYISLFHRIDSIIEELTKYPLPFEFMVQYFYEMNT